MKKITIYGLPLNPLGASSSFYVSYATRKKPKPLSSMTQFAW
jgi:hypothetical protein